MPILAVRVHMSLCKVGRKFAPNRWIPIEHFGSQISDTVRIRWYGYPFREGHSESKFPLMSHTRVNLCLIRCKSCSKAMADRCCGGEHVLKDLRNGFCLPSKHTRSNSCDKTRTFDRLLQRWRREGGHCAEEGWQAEGRRIVRKEFRTSFRAALSPPAK